MLHKILPIVAILFCFACEKTDEAPKPDGCDDKILERLGYVSVTSELIPSGGLDCVGFLSKLRFANGDIYYSPGCHCCDLVLQVLNCDGEDICSQAGYCPGYADAEVVSVIGVRE